MGVVFTRWVFSTRLVMIICFYFVSRSDSYEDNLANAAIWLHKATGVSQYLNDAKSYYSARSGTPWAFSWNDARAGVAVRFNEHLTEQNYNID